MASTLKINNLDTASGTTITIPTGKQLIGTDTNSIKAPGMIVQVAHHTHSSQTTLTSQTWTATGTTLAFTPKYANSDLYIHVKVAAEISGAANTGVGYRIQKDGSTVYDNDYALYHSNSNDQRIDQVPILHVESAGNTTARTYTLDFKLRGGGQTRHNIYGDYTIMQIMEVAR